MQMGSLYVDELLLFECKICIQVTGFTLCLIAARCDLFLKSKVVSENNKNAGAKNQQGENGQRMHRKRFSNMTMQE
jgi:hypothetical protein